MAVADHVSAKKCPLELTHNRKLRVGLRTVKVDPERLAINVGESAELVVSRGLGYDIEARVGTASKSRRELDHPPADWLPGRRIFLFPAHRSHL